MPHNELHPSAIDFDFDGVINQIQSEGISREKLLDTLTKSQSLLVKLGSLETMTKKSREDILTMARQTINVLFKEYKKITYDESLKVYEKNIKVLGDAIGNAFGKKFELPDWDKMNDHLMSEKFDALHYYMNRSVFMLDQRVTLFELEGKKQLQDSVIQRILQERGSKDHGELLDDLLGMLNQHYPAGYIPLPVYRNGKREFRKISLDYYVNTWISDVEGSVHYWSQRSTYLKAGIDLVVVRTQEGGACPICSPEVGKIFSLTGADPDFKRLDFALPRHPNCDCYMVPMVADTGVKTDGELPESYPGSREIEDDLMKYTQEEGIPLSFMEIVQAGERPLMAATNKGSLIINDSPFPHLNAFNPYASMSRAFEKLRQGKQLAFDEVESLAGLRHELYHLQNKAHFALESTDIQNEVMELLVEVSSRYHIKEFHDTLAKRLSKKPALLKESMVQKVVDKGYGYQYIVTRFERVLKKFDIKRDDIKKDIEEIVNQKEPDYLKPLSELIAEKSGVSVKHMELLFKMMVEAPEMIFEITFLHTKKP